jgi:hypothetical protein
MEVIEGNVIQSGNHLYIEVPKELPFLKNAKGQVSVEGNFLFQEKKEPFHRRMIPTKTGYVLPIQKSIYIRLLQPTKVTVEIGLVEKKKMKHSFPVEVDYRLSGNGLQQCFPLNYQERINRQSLAKRKSFHLFKTNETIKEEELIKIKLFYESISPLIPGIKTRMDIVLEEETTCNRGAEFCLCFYSENKPHYLENIGYLGEAVDLFLPTLSIGTCWFGIGRPKKKEKDLNFVIMIAIAKVSPTDFRVDPTKTKRLELSETWHSDKYLELGGQLRFAPSACNSQPWLVEENDSGFSLYRIQKKRGIMPKNKITYYNKIDLGIYCYFFQLLKDDYLKQATFEFAKENDEEKELVAKIRIEKKEEKS